MSYLSSSFISILLKVFLFFKFCFYSINVLSQFLLSQTCISSFLSYKLEHWMNFASLLWLHPFIYFLLLLLLHLISCVHLISVFICSCYYFLCVLSHSLYLFAFYYYFLNILSPTFTHFFSLSSLLLSSSNHQFPRFSFLLHLSVLSQHKHSLYLKSFLVSYVSSESRFWSTLTILPSQSSFYSCILCFLLVFCLFCVVWIKVLLYTGDFILSFFLAPFYFLFPSRFFPLMCRLNQGLVVLEWTYPPTLALIHRYHAAFYALSHFPS